MISTETKHTRTQERAKPRWRQLAKSLVPDVYRETEESKPSTYTFFIYLKKACWEAHRTDNTQQLCRIYAFVHWAYDHPAENLWNPAGVSFLEHVFEQCKNVEDARKVVPWLRPDMLEITVKLMKHIGQPASLVGLVEEASRLRFSTRVGDVTETLQLYLSESGVH